MAVFWGFWLRGGVFTIEKQHFLGVKKGVDFDDFWDPKKPIFSKKLKKIKFFYQNLNASCDARVILMFA